MVARGRRGAALRMGYPAGVGVEETERATSRRTAAGATLHPFLYIVLECARPLAGGARVSLADVDEVVLERADARRVERRRSGGKTALHVGIPDRRMSSAHARVALGDGKVEIE